MSKMNKFIFRAELYTYIIGPTKYKLTYPARLQLIKIFYNFIFFKQRKKLLMSVSRKWTV